MKFRIVCLFVSAILMTIITAAVIMMSIKSNMSYRIFHDHVIDLNNSDPVTSLDEYEHVVLGNYYVDSSDSPDNSGVHKFHICLRLDNGERGERFDLIVNNKLNPELAGALHEIVGSTDDSIDKPMIDGYIVGSHNHSSSNSLGIIPGECGIDSHSMIRRIAMMLVIFLLYMVCSIIFFRKIGFNKSKT